MADKGNRNRLRPTQNTRIVLPHKGGAVRFFITEVKTFSTDAIGSLQVIFLLTLLIPSFAPVISLSFISRCLQGATEGHSHSFGSFPPLSLEQASLRCLNRLQFADSSNAKRLLFHPLSTVAKQPLAQYELTFRKTPFR